MYNEGQTAVFIKDLTGREYPAIAVVNRKRRVNGQRELSFSFIYTEINKDFMDYFVEDKGFGWKVLFKNEWYTITHPGYATNGDFFIINVTAILSFFVDLNGYYLQDKVEDKSFTPSEYFQSLFNSTPYSFVMVDNLYSNTLSYEDNQSKTQRFLYGVERFEGEFTVKGKVAYLYDQVGNEKDVILHEDLNINDVTIEVDASGFHTWAKGYGDLPEGDTAGDYQLEVEYRSPLIAKYGEIEGPAIKDGNFKDATSLTNAVKTQVENSYKVSTSINAVDLTNNGYPEMVLEEGDRIWLYVDKLKLNQQVRVVEIDETFDWEGNIINANYTVGNESITSRYKIQQYDTLKDFQDILSGRKRLEYKWLPEAVKRASEIINGNQDSLFKYLPGEIIGINQSNPNGYMRFNTDGIGFSRNGGIDYQTAMTYEGIVADAITTGTLNAALVRIMGANGYMFMDGDQFKAVDPTNANKYVKIIPGKATFSGGGIDIIRPDGFVVMANGMLSYGLDIQESFPFYKSALVNAPEDSVWLNTLSHSLQRCGFYSYEHVTRYLYIQVGRFVTGGGSINVRAVTSSGITLMEFTSNNSNPDDVDSVRTIIVDLGIPTGQAQSFYIEIRAVGEGAQAYYRRVRMWQNG
ncbi:phage tail protein [Metabacillus bambusae]|uniref:Phage tail protein n=1 Tax=Metabacillus bambusae TaxID=2795218 RepID=A0ABS3NC58_9BACI|nr:phage tail protein [Metabacillus bambusae]MBO1515650.1 phage tail protein [Metabacillus bambusae]